jgi:hypothetical protein
MKQRVLGIDSFIVLNKIIANSVTLNTGTSINTVEDLKEANDGNVFDIGEVTGAPGQDLIIDFVNVRIFNYVNILSYYTGDSNHTISIQLWHWINSVWDTHDSMNGAEDTMISHQIFIPDSKYYIGSLINKGRVRARLNHTLSGNLAHNSHTDEVSLLYMTV